MAYHKHRRRHHSTKNFIGKTMEKSVSVAKSTSNKYMPKVKHSIENVGSKVIKTSTKSVPFLQGITRKFFSMFSKKSTRKHRKYKR